MCKWSAGSRMYSSNKNEIFICAFYVGIFILSHVLLLPYVTSISGVRTSLLPAYKIMLFILACCCHFYLQRFYRMRLSAALWCGLGEIVAGFCILSACHFDTRYVAVNFTVNSVFHARCLSGVFHSRAVGTGPADPAAAGPIIWQARSFMFTLYQFSTTWVDSSRNYAIRRQVLMLKCTKFDFRWGSAPDPVAGFKAPTSKGREAKMEGRGRMENGWKKWRPYYYERLKKEVDTRDGRDLPDQCQTASYAPALSSSALWWVTCKEGAKLDLTKRIQSLPVDSDDLTVALWTWSGRSTISVVCFVQDLGNGLIYSVPDLSGMTDISWTDERNRQCVKIQQFYTWAYSSDYRL